MNDFDLLRLDDLALDELCYMLDNMDEENETTLELKRLLAEDDKEHQEAEVELDEVTSTGNKSVKRKQTAN